MSKATTNTSNKEMFGIHGFTFKYNLESIEFLTAKEAITYFNQRGYGMNDWKIIVDYAGSAGNTEISLATFNYITDVQELIDSKQ